MANYRDGYLEQGAPTGMVPYDVTLIADNTIVNVVGVSLLRIRSDNSTPANRTFTLTDGGVVGQDLVLVLESDSSTSAQLADSGNVKLQSPWEPLQYDSLRLVWDGAFWVEVGRGLQAGGFFLSGLADANLLIYDAGDGRFENKALSGDVTVSAAGVAAISSGVIVNADVNASAAIAYSKLNLTGSLAVADMAPAVMREVTGTISQAQMLALSTPVSLIAAGGAGTVHIVDEIELLHTYSTAAYATGSDVSIEYATTGDDIVLIADSFFTAGASANTVMKPSTYDLDGSTGTGYGFDVTANANKAVQITASNFTNGNVANIFKYRIRYHTVTLLT